LVLSFVAILIAGCTGPGHATELPVDETTAARKLYVAKCAKCHKFYDPAKYSDEEWQKWMAKMSKKSKLTPEQSEVLARYIEDTFRSPKANPN
jgi:hypothetical protein